MADTPEIRVTMQETFGDPGRRRVFLVIPATSLGVRAGLQAMIERLGRSGVKPCGRGSVELVMAEVMNNIVEHAYHDAPDGKISLQFELEDDEVFCKVTDTGHPLPGLSMPDCPLTIPIEDLADLPEGGFGWMLIRSMSNTLAYDRRLEENHLSVRIPVSVA